MTAAGKTFYSNLLINQYIGKPKAYATVKDIVDLDLMGDVILDIKELFDLRNAFGEKLDIVGSYVGVSRDFVFMGTGASLSDAEMKIALRMAIVRNNIGSSGYDIEKRLRDEFGSEIDHTDNLNMTISYSFSPTTFTPLLISYFIATDSLPRPTGVSIRDYNTIAVTLRYYGFREYSEENENVTSMNTYASYDEDTTFRRYA